MKAAQNDSISEFLSESEEILQRLSINLQKLEGAEALNGEVDEIYRDVHTLKGSAFLFGYKQIGNVAHAMEASLDPVRKLNIKIPPGLAEICFKCLDLIDRIVKDLRLGRQEEPFANEVNTIIPYLVEVAAKTFGSDLQQENEPALNFVENRIEVVVPQVNEIPASPKIEGPPNQTEIGTVAPEIAATKDTASNVAAPVETTVRVHVMLLDRLMNLVGELVLVRNQVLQFANKYEDLEFLNLSKAVDVVTSDLQGEVMRTRMQPIGNILSKFQRLVRDLSRDLEKRIDITLQGTETELDKTLIESIKDPLTHLIRNSCDHGIEIPADRTKASKPETGHILVRAYHEGGQVVIEVSDDGAGLNRDKLISKALEKGLVSQERAAKLTDREAYNLIFHPGFSTAKQVTNVSGRGVGMDVVKTNIEKIGGSIELNSSLGKGTTIRLKIPLTLAIVPAVLVRSASARFAIPQVKLVELVRLEEGKNERIELLQGRPVFRLRGELLPLVSLREILGASLAEEKTGGTNIVVLNADGQFFGLLIDEILDTADIVVKPLGSFLNERSFFSGATVMGDGSVVLILDVTGIAKASRIDTKKSKGDGLGADAVTVSKAVNYDAQEFLVFQLNSAALHAIPLCLVHRLEEIQESAVEVSGEQRVVRYREAILPLISLNRFLGYSTENEFPLGERVSVIVLQYHERHFGLVVKDIRDIVYVEDVIDDSIRDRNGVLGNVVLREKIVTVVDALGIIEHEENRLKGTRAEISEPRSALDEIRLRNRDYKFKKVRVLFADDVSFFRKQVSKILLQQGFDVTVAEDGAVALRILEESSDEQFNLILSDIEMPKLNGLQLAREIRKVARFKDIPLIALTTRFKESDIAEGKAAGFDLYLEKLNPDKLLAGISEVMNAKSEGR